MKHCKSSTIKLLSLGLFQLALLVGVVGFSGISSSQGSQRGLVKTEVVSRINKISGRTTAYARPCLEQKTTAESYGSECFLNAIRDCNESTKTQLYLARKVTQHVPPLRRFQYFIPHVGEAPGFSSVVG